MQLSKKQQRCIIIHLTGAGPAGSHSAFKTVRTFEEMNLQPLVTYVAVREYRLHQKKKHSEYPMVSATLNIQFQSVLKISYSWTKNVQGKLNLKKKKRSKILNTEVFTSTTTTSTTTSSTSLYDNSANNLKVPKNGCGRYLNVRLLFNYNYCCCCCFFQSQFSLR